MQTFVKIKRIARNCLVDDSVGPMIESSYVINSRVERRADSGALYLMIKDYLATLSIEMSEFNISYFMQPYDIPTKYFYLVADVATTMNNNRIPNIWA